MIEPAVDEHPRARRLEQETTAGDGAGRAEEAQDRHRGAMARRHVRGLRSAAATSGATRIALVGCGMVSHETRRRTPAARMRSLGAGREDRMRDDRVDRADPAPAERARGRGDRGAAARDVVDDHRAGRGAEWRHADGDAAVAVTPLAADDPGRAGGGGDRTHPRCRFGIGSDHAGVARPAEPGRHGGSRGERPAAGGDHVREPPHAMQMGLDREHGIERVGEPTADDALRERLARAEHAVLPHVGQVRCDQRHPACAGASQGVGGEQRLD